VGDRGCSRSAGYSPTSRRWVKTKYAPRRLLFRLVDGTHKPAAARRGRMKVIRDLVLVCFLIPLFGGCGGGGGDESASPPDPNAPVSIGRGFIRINSPSDGSTFTTESGSVSLSGNAFISPTSFRCCSGSATDTGVTVTSTSGSVAQTAHYCRPFGFGPLTICEHTWTTTISLVVGKNQFSVEASDADGNYGRDSITITRGPDSTRPTVTSITPLDGASNVAVNASISATFSEEMDMSSISPATFQLRDSGGRTIAGAVTLSNRTATFRPSSSLAGVVLHTASISGQAKDLTGNLVLPHSWTFTTGVAPDLTPPTVLDFSPPDGSACTPLDATVTALFNESINPTTVNTSTFTLRDSTGNALSGAVTAPTSTSFAFTPLSSLAFASTYTASLATGIRDVAGNATTADHSWIFTTVPDGIGTWQGTSLNGPSVRFDHSLVWTGFEAVVWGGAFGQAGQKFNTGARYQPLTDTWVPMTAVGAPAARSQHAAVWTGSEMVVWGGETDTGRTPGNGGRYDPVTDTWRSMSDGGFVGGGTFLNAVWSGTEMLIWDVFRRGNAYNPATDSWRALPPPPSELGTFSSLGSVVWTGTQLIVWGGTNADCASGICIPHGAIYDVAADTWTLMSNVGAPSARHSHASVWTGSEMAVWGGLALSPAAVTNTGALYNPQTNTWRSMSTVCAPAGRSNHRAVWTGNEMVVWGGPLRTGARYDPFTNSWQQMAMANLPSDVRSVSPAVWSGSEMIVWGGLVAGTGAKYRP
jgi:hypothetical protein